MNCPECQTELAYDDTFGNLDHCLEYLGHPRNEGSRPREPRKAGDIYWCPKCEDYYHTFDRDPDAIHFGYPC